MSSQCNFSSVSYISASVVVYLGVVHNFSLIPNSDIKFSDGVLTVIKLWNAMLMGCQN